MAFGESEQGPNREDPAREGLTPTDWAAALDEGRRLFLGPCDFVAGVPSMDVLPPMGPQEVAFAGRSNVGKSSLINALTGRNTLAKTSATPGRTRQLNYFSLGGQLMLVDMPGYGYAEAPKTEIARWNRLIDSYLKGRQTLRRVMVLVDARHGIKPNDLETMTQLDKAAVPYQVVLTKMDKLKKGERDARLAETKAALAKRPAAHPEIVATSSETGEGIADLRGIIGLLRKL